jgi:hypothetical protein
MENKSKIIQVYGVVVCVVAVITFLISLSSFVSAVIDKNGPKSSERYSSFESYKMDAMEDISKDNAYIPSEDELEQMYIASNQKSQELQIHRYNRDMIVSGITILVAIVLFGFHFWLIRRLNSK